MVIELELSRGKKTLIDDIDEDLSQFKWYLVETTSKSRSNYYAYNQVKYKNGRYKYNRLHRVILERVLGRILSKREEVDHINHNGLDNRRENIRLATRSENQHNQRIRTFAKSSRYKGVDWYKRYCKWRARIQVNGKSICIGFFDIEEDAARAYDMEAKRTFPTFCYLNFGGVL